MLFASSAMTNVDTPSPGIVEAAVSAVGCLMEDDTKGKTVDRYIDTDAIAACTPVPIKVSVVTSRAKS
jgi:hypothetical protein